MQLELFRLLPLLCQQCWTIVRTTNDWLFYETRMCNGPWLKYSIPPFHHPSVALVPQSAHGALHTLSTGYISFALTFELISQSHHLDEWLRSSNYSAEPLFSTVSLCVLTAHIAAVLHDHFPYHSIDKARKLHTKNTHRKFNWPDVILRMLCNVNDNIELSKTILITRYLLWCKWNYKTGFLLWSAKINLLHQLCARQCTRL